MAEVNEKMVKVRLPLTKELKDDVFVRVNERTWLIKRGVEVEIPKCAAEVLHNSEVQMLEAIEFENQAQKKA